MVTIHRLIAECSMDLRVIEKQRLKLKKMRGLFLCNREHVPKEDLAVYDSMNMFMEKSEMSSVSTTILRL